MAITSEYRDILALALASVTSHVYPSPPPVPIPPAVVVANDNPWMIPDVIGGRLRTEVRYRIMVCVADRADALTQLEDLVESTLVALPAGVQLVEVGAPQSMDTGPQGSLLVAEIRISVHLKET